MNKQTPVKLADLEDALMFVGAGSGHDTTVWLCRETGAVFWHSDDADEFEPLPGSYLD